MSGKNNTFKSMMLKYFLYYLVIVGIAFNIVVFKAEGGELKKLWSESMVFVNFAGLVFLFLRFAKKPLVNYLKGEGDKIGEQLQSIEADVKDAKARMEAEAEKIKDLDDNLAGITESIIAAGAREKESIIERAQAIADKMVSDAKKEADFKMLTARKRFSEEMLEAAINITADNIKLHITKEDDEKLVDEFTTDMVGSGENLFT